MFNQTQKLIALSICHIFETGKPLGDSSAVAVLKDGAGISYGIPQATHRSGNLADVLERYISGTDEPLYEPLFREWLPTLRKTTSAAIAKAAANTELKRALKESGDEPEMRRAQLANVDSRMNKAVRACDGSGFTSTMALAVVYDSINHGSWERIRDRIPALPEKRWIEAYVKERQRWLSKHSNPLLRKTVYRTKFFLTEISLGNWDLDLPLMVHGFNLTRANIEMAKKETEDLRGTGANTAAHEDEATRSPTEDRGEVEGDGSSVDVPSTQDPHSTVTQNADQIINTGDQTPPVETSVQSIDAPGKQGTVNTATTTTVLGITVPPAILLVYTTVTDLVTKGYVDAQDLGSLGLTLLKDNYKYIFGLIGVIILLLIIKKIGRMITFWIQMISLMVPTFNTVKVVRPEIEMKSRWWEFWKL